MKLKIFSLPLLLVSSLGAVKIPIVYHKKYNFTSTNIQIIDTQKYKKIHDYILEHLGFQQDELYEPEKISDKALQEVHTLHYLQSLNAAHLAEIMVMPRLKNLPTQLLHKLLLKPMKYATAGTILAAQLAIKYCWAINLGGGYHHAKADSGGGFCVYADIPLAIKKLREANPHLKVLYVDLDAHQGNGVESVLADDEKTYILDCYNPYNYPKDYKAAQAIKKTITDISTNQHYLEQLKKALPEAIEEFEPDFIMYNAGADCYEKDPLGGMPVTQEGIVDRDETVFQHAHDNKIPICMILSGGYAPENAGIIGKSIENLFKKKLLENS